MATGYKDFSASNGVLRVNYSYTQDSINNKTSVSVTSIQFKSTNWYQSWFYADGIVTIAGNAVTYSNNGEDDGCNVLAKDTFYTLGSGKTMPSFEVSHDSNGKGSFVINVGPRSGTGYSQFNVFCDMSMSGNFATSGNVTVNLPQIDRTAPVVTITATAASTTSISLSATANVNCDIWQYKLDSGSWTQFSTTNGTSASTSLTGLSSASHTVQVRARKKLNRVYGSSDTASVDLVAPTVSFTVTSIGVDSFTINATSNVSCNKWQYKLGSGSWTDFSTTSGTSASKTISGLTPDTSYTIQVRARKTSNNLYGTASSKTVKTLGPSALNSATGGAIDVSSPTISINVTVNSTFYHKLHFYASDGTTLITTKSLGSYSACTNTAKTVSLTSTNRTNLLNQIPDAKTLSVKVQLETFTDSGYTNSIGTSEMKTISLTTSASVSAPTFSGFTYSDTESAVTSVTGDNQTLVQSLSHLVVNATAGTAKNGASISGYSVSIGDVSMTFTGTTLDVGAVSSTGNLTLKVTCTDSRGYSTSVSQTVTVIAYKKPRLSSYTLRRQNEVDAIVQLSFSGSVSTVKVSSVEKNAVASIKVKYKKTSASSWTTKTLTSSATISGLSFSYSNLEFVELDVDYSYDFVLTITDNFGTLTQFDYTDILNQGTPLLSFRRRSTAYPFPRVGLNKPNPEAPLDVAGDIHMNGYRVVGFAANLGDSGVNLNTLTEPGYYTQQLAANALSSLNYPEAHAGFLEILTMPNGRTLQRYTIYDCSKIYYRSKSTGSSGTWGDWSCVVTGISGASPIIKVSAFTSASLSISANTSGNVTIDCSETGYTPIGIVGVAKSGSYSSLCMLYEFRMDSTTPTNARVYFRNIGSNDTSITVTVRVLMVKNGIT